MSLKKQSSILNAFTRHVNFCKTINVDSTASVLQARLGQVKQLYNEFCELQTLIEEACNDKDALELQFITRGQVEDYYFLCVSDLQEALNGRNVVQPVMPNVVNQNASNDIKLPKIAITAFSGEYEDWPSFKDLYNTLIHNKASLSKVQKLHYLKSSVEGGAEGLIKSISITEANYDIAWKKLTDRYEHKRYIVDSHLKTLLNQPQIRFEDHKAIKALIDKSSEKVRALQVLGLPVNQWDAFLVHIVVSKLDSESHKQWELKLKKDELPTFTELEEYLEARWQSLEMIDKSTESQQSTSVKQFSTKNSQRSYQSTNSTQQPTNSASVKISFCIYCNKTGHMTGFCPEYLNLSHDNKTNFVKSKKLCFNCLRPNHSLASCTNRASCAHCGKKHHSSLHVINKNQSKESTNQSNQQSNPSQAHQQGQPHQAHAINSSSLNENQVLLATAIVNVTTSSGLKIPARALIDKGGDHSIIQEKFARKLGLMHQKESTPIVGIGEVVAQTDTHLVKIEIESFTEPEFKLEVKTYTMKTISGNLPSIPIERQKWPHLRGIKLADNQFETSAPIQLLLGAEVYEEILLEGVIQKKENSPTAVNSRLGWLLFGKVKAKLPSTSGIQIHHTLTKQDSLEEALRSFWELEEVPYIRKLTVKEQQAMDIFQQNKSRNEEGRYVVSLPFDPSKASELLGESKSVAVQCLYRLEKRFQSNPIIKERYGKYIQNLIDSNHIELVPSHRKNIPNHEKFYLPHHPVLRESSLSTKLRVVFNASQKTKSGISLNEKLLVGPKTQEDLFDILIRWRKHPIAFIADIEKMYRQVKLIQDHRDYQRFLWRFSSDEPIEEYRITTVIDGTSPAQFLATQALRQLGEDLKHQYPEASSTVLKDFYIDDLSSGSHDTQSALKLQNDLINLLKQGGFILKKWLSNSQEVLNNVPKENQHEPEALIELIEKGVKTLGILWNQKEDSFQFQVTPTKIREQTSKRRIMSDACKIFDPIGWISPVTVKAKIFLQSLWTLSDIKWDDRLPEHKLNEWQIYRHQLPAVEKIRIPRWIGTKPEVKVQIHGFADASNLAYAAVVYTRIVQSDGKVKISLISSKTKVAPLKIITTPKLELCGCVLLANLVSRIKKAFDFNSAETYLYSDSTTALAWINSHPNHWNIFVANRITEIQQQTEVTSWRFIETNQNPADCASRGLNPGDLENHHLWWKGPTWLEKNQENWPNQKQNKFETEVERRRVIQIMHLKKTLEVDYMYSILQEHSDLFKLQSRTVFLLRWRQKMEKMDGMPTAQELKFALNAWIKFTQLSVFNEEIICCQHNEELSSKSKLISLRPFLDKDGILRVGGRLKRSKLQFNSKHPIILPKRHHFTKLIIEQAHQLTLHGGPSLMSSFLSKYWILGKSDQIKRVVKNCVSCFRYTAKPEQQIMRDLPASRVTPSRIFSHCGIDFAGPISTKSFIGRCRGKFTQTITKSYIAIFVCMSTRAIHLEAVSDYTSVSFIAAFKRFVAKRGKVTNLYSDNGSNFVGADRQLREEMDALLESKEVQSYFARDGTLWHFNPPSAPHFGGLWEAGVKSTKHHLKRIAGHQVFTFEELTTLLAQIEACLNSRPLCPMKEDINDNSYLTPGHFILGDASITIPEQSLLDTNINRLSRWQLVQRIYQEFWRCWSTDYLSKLQQRPKWMKETENVRVGQLCLYRDEKLPPTKWPIARVIEIHPGDDDNVRVVTLKTPFNVLKRPITKISVLPIKDNFEEDSL